MRPFDKECALQHPSLFSVFVEGVRAETPVVLVQLNREWRWPSARRDLAPVFALTLCGEALDQFTAALPTS
jgi:hypothetical protein